MKVGARIYDLLCQRYGVVIRLSDGGMFYQAQDGGKHFAFRGEVKTGKTEATKRRRHARKTESKTVGERADS